jgi:hypothetical protein
MVEDLTIDITGEKLPDLYEIIDGEAVAVDDDPFARVDPKFGENLAMYMGDNELARIADDILRKIEYDIEARKPWIDRFRRGLELMGLHESDMDDGPFPGASTAVHPLITEAMVQFWARALPEILPSDGPIKAAVIGEKTPEKVARAQRIEDYLNYQCLVEDKPYYAEKSRLLMSVPYQGCAFIKTWRDYTLDRTCGRLVGAEDLIIPYGASTLEESPRFTHRMMKTRNEVRKLMSAGFWIDCELASPMPGDLDDEVRELKANATDIDLIQDDIDDARHEIYECAIEYDLPGFADVNDSGRETGVALPYLITIDKASRKILSVYRNWKETDRLKERVVYFTKYGYIPGFGIYDFGLFHLIGGLSEAATGALRVILDGAATASLQGGFKTKEGKKLGEGRVVIEPGVWKPVDVSADDMSKAFFTPPFKEPSNVLFQMLGFLVEAGQRFSSTTEALTGDAPTNSPVGTTVALIEQGSKVFSAIHRGLHHSAAHEHKIRYDLAREFMPEEGYPYDVDGDEREVFKEDFAPGISVVPVSDPNIFSQTQRVALAQAAYQLAVENPGIMDRRTTVKALLEALRMPGVDEMMLNNEAMQPLDPVSENQAFLVGKPVKVFPEQDHMAHIQVHLAFMMHPGFGGNLEAQEMLLPVMKAHMAEHMAALYARHMQTLGVPAQSIDAKAPGSETGIMIPPAMGDHIGRLAAQASAQFMQMPGLPNMQPEPEQPPEPDPIKVADSQFKLQADQEKHVQNLQHKEEDHKQKLAHEEANAMIAGKKDIMAAINDIRSQQEKQDMAALEQMLANLPTDGVAPN